MQIGNRVPMKKFVMVVHREGKMKTTIQTNEQAKVAVWPLPASVAPAYRPGTVRELSKISILFVGRGQSHVLYIGSIDSRRSAWALKCIGTEMHCPSHILSRRSAWLSWIRRSHGSAQHHTPRVRGHGGPVGGLGDGGYRRSGAKIRGVILYKVDFDFVRAPVPGVGVRAAWRGSEAILLTMQCRGRTGRVQWVRDAHESRTRESSCDDLNDVHQDSTMTCTNLYKGI